MKKITLALLAFFLTASGLALASQGEEQKERPSMMEEMMKNDRQGDHGGGMMRMMKMMDQCAAMMESHDSEGGKERQKQ